MTASDLICEIHRVREKQAAECDFQPRLMGERLRERQRVRVKEGVRYASFVQRSPVEGESLVGDSTGGAA